MSTRYVWDKSTVEYKINAGSTITRGFEFVHTDSYDPDDWNHSVTISWKESNEVTIKNGSVILKNPSSRTETMRGTDYGEGSHGEDYPINKTYFEIDGVVYKAGSGCYIQLRKNVTALWWYFTADLYNYCNINGVRSEKGQLIGSSSNGNNSKYPQNGIYDSYWYTYKGSDTIDPASVSYPVSPKSTVPITLTVTPSKGNTYGGTVSYQYEVSLDGGNSWAQLGLTTAVTQQYTIPKGTQTFRCRVQARDNLGFTSSDWIYGPQVNVINNSAPAAPGSITVPVSPRGGADTTITWTKSTDVDGNLSGYRLEGQVDGGDWTQLYDGPNLSYVDVIPKGALTAAYRVKAYDSDGEESPYTTSPTRTVINNNPPIITCDLSSDLGIKEAGFTVPYTVTDQEGGTVTVVEKVGDLVKRTFTPTLGQSNTFQITGEYFMRILNGPQTISIVATDEGGLSSTYNLTFTKQVFSMSVTLANPLEVEDPITVAIMSVLQSIPEDANYQILVTNNAKDAEPVWQDATADVKAGRNIVFANKTQANGPAFNFKLTASRAKGGQGGYVKLLKGAFQ